MVFGWHESKKSYDQLYNDDSGDHKASLGDEAIGGGIAMAGFRAFEDHQRKEGKPVKHALAKDILAGFVGAEVDKYAQSKGENSFDREKAKRNARQQAEQMYDDHYIQGEQADSYDPNAYGPPPAFAL